MGMILEYLNKLQRKGNMRDFPAPAGDTRTGLRPARSDARRDQERSDALAIQELSSSGKIAASGSAGRPAVLGGHAGKGRRRSRPGDGEAPDVAPDQRLSEGLLARGRFGFMQYIHGFIGLLLVMMALIHVPFPDPLQWLPYAVAAALAFLTLSRNLSTGISRVLAICSTAMMFFFFALFFLLVPRLEADWYTTQYGWSAVCRILGAFLMIPILSDYSCRLKKECLEAREARRTAFFSVPSNVRPHGR